MLVARLLGLVLLFSAALGVTAASEAHASGPVTLQWSAPADCPTGDDVLTEINRLLGARTSADQTTLDVEAKVQRKDDGTYLVRLEIPGTDGPRVREVSAVSCAALGQAAALILAMMVDPEAALTAPPAPDSSGAPQPGQTPAAQVSPNVADPKETKPGRGPSETPPPAKPVTPPATTLPAISPPISREPEKKAPVSFRRPLFSVSVPQAFVDVGSLPDPAFGLGVAFGVFPGRLRFEAGLFHLFENSGQILTLSKASTNVSLTAFHGSVGFAFVVNPDLEFIPRVQLDAGRLRAASFGVSDEGEGAGDFVDLGIGGVASVRLAQYFRLRMGFDLLALLAYPEFIVTGVGVAYKPEPVVGRLSLGLEVRF